MSFTAIYYSTGNLEAAIRDFCLTQLSDSVDKAGGELITLTTAPCEFGMNHLIPKIQHPHLDIFTRIITGCQLASHPLVFLTEHDVLYPPTHFEDGVVVHRLHPANFNYNANYIHLDPQGWYEGQKLPILSQLFAPAAMIAKAFSEKREGLLAQLKAAQEEDIRVEPGDAGNSLKFNLTNPSVDIRHTCNLTDFGQPAPDDDHFPTHPYWGAANHYAKFWP